MVGHPWVKIKACLNVLAARTKDWPTVGIWVGRWCWVAYSVGGLTVLGYSKVPAGVGWEGWLYFYYHLSCLPSSSPFLRGHGLTWLQCCQLGRWLGHKTPKQRNKWMEEQTNKLSYSLKALVFLLKIIHVWKWKVISGGDLSFSKGEGEIF